jgi:hypothetical protein
MEHGDIPLDVASVVKQVWEAPDEALFTQKDLEAVTGLSGAYFERGRWAGYGPKFLKLGGRLVRYTKGDSVSWIKQNPSVASTSETLPHPVGSPRGPRKKLEHPRGDAKQKALAKPSPTPEAKSARRTKPAPERPRTV